MAYGWHTTQTETGFTWAITLTTWNADLGRATTSTIKAGASPSRARATGAAKRWVLFFRRGGSL
jgi:hypothetical protein